MVGVMLNSMMRWPGLRAACLLPILGSAMAGGGCNSTLDNPIKPVVVTGAIVISINIIATQIDSVTVQLQAFAQSTDGSVEDATSRVGWGSSNNSVATVTTTGLVKAVGNGSVEITASLDGVIGRFPLNVTGF